MLTKTESTMKYLRAIFVIAWIVFSIFMNYGCMIIKTDHAFIYTFAKTVDAEALGLVADPNQTRIGSGQTKTKNDSVTVITPGVGIKSSK